MLDKMQDQSEVLDNKPTVSAEALLETYVRMWNESDGQATFQDVADTLGMNLANVRQRIYKLKNDLIKQGVTLPLMRGTNAPRKVRNRTDYSKLAILAQAVKIKAAESSEIV